MRIRRDTYDLDGTAIAKEIVHGITSLDPGRGTPAILAGLDPRANGASSRSTGCATPPTPKTPVPDMPETAPRSWPPSGTSRISLLHLAGITEITRTLQAISRDRNRVLNVLPL